MLKVLDLFSGIGGFSLGLERTGGFETVAFCEIDPFCQKVLKKHWPDTPIYNDVRNLEYDGPVDVICGGYPCQPFSTAGRRKGKEDDRHLWPAMFDLIQKYRPAWVIGENVAGHVSMGLDDVLIDLAGADYSARPFVIPACAVDAPHRRNRVWVIANTRHAGIHQRGQLRDAYETCKESRGMGPDDQSGISNQETTSLANSQKLFCNGGDDNGENCGGQISELGNGWSGSDVSDSTSLGQSGQGESIKRGCSTQEREGQADKPISVREPCFWPIEPDVGRVANGVPKRVDRLRTLGNAVVPQIPEMIGYAILEAEKETQ